VLAESIPADAVVSAKNDVGKGGRNDTAKVHLQQLEKAIEDKPVRRVLSNLWAH
jgi:hypothetical protein